MSGFLLGAFGKLMAGRRVRMLQKRLVRAQSRLARATKKAADMEKQLQSAKQRELNNLSFQQSMAMNNMPANLRNSLFAEGISDEDFARIAGYGGAGLSSGSTDAELQEKIATYQYHASAFKNSVAMDVAQFKQQIEDKYENIRLASIEPLKQEEDALSSEKDSLESQVTIAKADYDSMKELEKSGAQDLKVNYNGVA